MNGLESVRECQLAECGGNALFQPALLPLCCGNPLSSYESRSTAQPNQRKKRSPHPNPNLHSLGWIQCYLTQLCLQRTFRAQTHTRLQTHKMEGGMSSTQISLQRLFVLFDVFFFSTCLEVKLFSLSECSTVSPKISFQAENESLSDYSEAES